MTMIKLKNEEPEKRLGWVVELKSYLSGVDKDGNKVPNKEFCLYLEKSDMLDSPTFVGREIGNPEYAYRTLSGAIRALKKKVRGQQIFNKTGNVMESLKEDGVRIYPIDLDEADLEKNYSSSK